MSRQGQASDSKPAMPFRGWLVFGLFRVFGALPLRALQAVGGWLGRQRRGRGRRIVEYNLALCFPELDEARRGQLADQALAGLGRGMFEAFAIWTRPRRALAWIRHVHGAEYLQRARGAGNGVLVLAPHLGVWELLNLYLADTGPGAVLYRPASWPALDAAIIRGRGALGVCQIPADRNAPRTIIRRLAAGDAIGILPDQQPRQGEGEFVPFFGLQALTMTLAARLAQRAPTLFAWARRLPDAQGFDLHFEPADPALADPDPIIATSAMNAQIEAMVRRHPEQYVWDYKRFSLRPEGEPERYGPGTRRAWREGR